MIVLSQLSDDRFVCFLLQTRRHKVDPIQQIDRSFLVHCALQLRTRQHGHNNANARPIYPATICRSYRYDRRPCGRPYVRSARLLPTLIYGRCSAAHSLLLPVRSDRSFQCSPHRTPSEQLDRSITSSLSLSLCHTLTLFSSAQLSCDDKESSTSVCAIRRIVRALVCCVSLASFLRVVVYIKVKMSERAKLSRCRWLHFVVSVAGVSFRTPSTRNPQEKERPNMIASPRERSDPIRTDLILSDQSQRDA